MSRRCARRKELSPRLTGSSWSIYQVRRRRRSGQRPSVTMVLHPMQSVVVVSSLTLSIDHELGRLFDALDGEYTVVMFSDPNEFNAYEPEFTEPAARIVEAVHMDLKREDGSAVAA